MPGGPMRGISRNTIEGSEAAQCALAGVGQNRMSAVQNWILRHVKTCKIGELERVKGIEPSY